MKSIIIATVCLAAATIAVAQDQLSAARDLYASASYEDALTLLTRLHDENAGAPLAAKADQYRAFCLFALGRTVEATAVAEQLIVANPDLALEGDASPRIAAMFTDARKRLLPTLVREQYRAARAAMDKKDYAAAEPQLTKARRLVDEAAAAGIADDTIADLGVLVDGFLDLARSGIARSAGAPAASARAPSPQAAAAPPASESAATADRTPQIFDSTSQGVVGPVAIRQDMPPLPRDLARIVQQTNRGGILELIIDEKGAVERAIMRESVQPLYDNLLVAAAKSWRYQPAVQGTTPVKYVKVIAVNVTRNVASPQQ